MAVSLLFYCNSCKEARLLTGPVQKSYKFIRKNDFPPKHICFYMVFDPPRTLFFDRENEGQKPFSSPETKEKLPHHFRG